MLRPSTSVCGLTDTALQTTEQVEKSFELAVRFFLEARVRDGMEPTKHCLCLGVREDKVSSDWVLLQRGDTSGLNREAAAICVCFRVVNSLSLFVTLIVSLQKKRSEDENAKLRRVFALGYNYMRLLRGLGFVFRTVLIVQFNLGNFTFDKRCQVFMLLSLTLLYNLTHHPTGSSF